MNEDERFALRVINGASQPGASPQPNTTDSPAVSRPQLEHVGSRQSITATEEFESAEDPGSSGVSAISDDEHPGTFQRYSTPPQAASPEMTSRAIASTQDTTQRVESGTEEGAYAAGVRFSDRTVRRKPVGSPSPERTPRVSQLEPGGSPPTPGVDDTPYIRFALDQLTRDEEVRGSRKYGPTGGFEDQRAFDQTTQPATLAPIVLADEKALPPPPITTDPRLVTPAAPAMPPYQHFRRFNSDGQQPGTLQQPEVFIPFDPPFDSLAYPALNFVPGVLRTLWLGVFLFFCLLMFAGLLYCAIYPLVSNNGLYDYSHFGGSRYFVFQYMPTMFGMLLLLWLFQIQIALERIAPFVCMASSSVICRSEGPHLELHPTSFLIPKTFYFRAGQPVIGAAMMIFWLFLWTVPLLACMFGVVWYGSPATGTWRWVTVQGVVWTVIVLYILLIWIIIVLLFWLPRQNTGLKWDPRSLADLICLISQSNITEDYNGTETFATSADFHDRLLSRSDRLGYWHTSLHPNHVFYAIGEEGGVVRRYSVENGKIREKSAVERSSFPDTPTTYGANYGPDINLESGDLDIDEIQHRYLPWYLRPSLVLLWSVTLIVLYLAFIIVSFVNDAIIHGFAPLTPVRPNNSGFGAANFLYSFMPALIAHGLFLAWLSIDYSYRHLQPYADLSNTTNTHYDTSKTSTSRPPFGADAAHSLLLDYPARFPLSVTLAAFSARHLRVAWFSILSLIASTLPILAGGAFWAQWYTDVAQVRVAVDPPGYYALCVFLALIAASLPLALPGLRARRGLPHASKTLAQTLSWLYASARPAGRGWADVGGGRAQMVTRLLEREATFAFGLFIDARRGGKRCLGVYRLPDGEDDARDGEKWDARHLSPQQRQPVLQQQQQPPPATMESAYAPPDSRQGLMAPSREQPTTATAQAMPLHRVSPTGLDYGAPGAPPSAYLAPTPRDVKATSSDYGDDLETGVREKEIV